MRLRILGCGTSTGVPIPGCGCSVCSSKHPRNMRTRTSALIELSSGENILIDSSTDLRYQALRDGISRIDAVLFTHAHSDHILGIDDLRCFNFSTGRSIPCYGSDETLESIRRMFSYIFEPDPDWEGGMVAQLTLNPLCFGMPLDVCGVQILPLQVLHGRSAVCAFRFGSFGYATDCNSIPPESRDALRNLDCLILDGLRFEPHKTHFTISEACELAAELKAKRTCLIHMTHTIDYEKVNPALPEGVELAYDGMVLDI